MAISSDVDCLAKRKQKLLDRKRNRESKGKAIALDQPPKGESANVVDDSDVAMLKTADEDDIPIANCDPFIEERVHLSFPLDGLFFSEPKDLLDEARNICFQRMKKIPKPQT